MNEFDMSQIRYTAKEGGKSSFVFYMADLALCPWLERECHSRGNDTRWYRVHWVELFFSVKVIAMNSHRVLGRSKRTGRNMEHPMHYRCMLITLQLGYSILPLRKINLQQINKYCVLHFEKKDLGFLFVAEKLFLSQKINILLRNQNI